jgi:hypothetical protein
MIGTVTTLTAFGVGFDPRVLTKHLSADANHVMILLQFLAQDMRAGVIVLDDLAGGCDRDGQEDMLHSESVIEFGISGLRVCFHGSSWVELCGLVFQSL